MVKINQLFLTNNDCYKKGGKHTPKGVMWHSTGAPNPELRRYLGPDDGVIGKNKYNNHWNQPGISKAVHAFIGKDKNGVAKIYQTLPWDLPGWHSGSGSLGFSRNANNNDYIGFEICEDNLKDRNYFEEVYELGIQLSVYLVKKYKIPINNVISHAEGHRRGIASNHGDPDHWLRRFGKSMNDARAEVKRRVSEPVKETPTQPIKENKKEIKVGDTVTVANHATHYQTGHSIASFVKGNKYKVIQVKNVNQSQSKKAYLLGGIMSWVLEQDLEESSVSHAPAPKETSKPSLKVGSKVRIKQSTTKYATGQNIPNWVKARTYTIQQVRNDRVLLKEITSWVFAKDIE